MILPRRCLLTIAGLGAAVAASAALAGGPAPVARLASSVRFEANVGQSSPEVRYVARGAQYGLFLKSNEMTLALRSGRTAEQRLAARTPGANPLQPVETSVLRMSLAGAAASAPSAVASRPLFNTRYLRQSGTLAAPTYQGVSFQCVYPGIDVAYYGKGSAVEHDFVVKPGADPSRIAMDFVGASNVVLRNGELVVSSRVGAVRWAKPVAYQIVDGRRVSVPASYRVAQKAGGAARVAFQVAKYDTGRTLVIDPILSFSTYLGGSADEDDAWGVAVGPTGAIAVVGQTWSADYPAPGYPLSGTSDAFLTILNSSGTVVLGSALFGGSGDDAAYSAAADAAGNLYIGGATSSSDFPTSGGAAQTTFGGGVDGFIVKMNSAGSPVFSTLAGGSNVDVVYSVAVDGTGAVAFGGQTRSANLPVVGSWQVYQGGYDGMVGKLAVAGSSFQWLSFYAGYGDDAVSAVAYDATGNICIAGTTTSVGFPATANGFGSSVKGGTDFFGAKIAGAGASLVYAGRSGGAGNDIVLGLAVNSTGALFITGYTTSTNLPVTAGAPISTAPGGTNAFLCRTNDAGSVLTGVTYLGGSGTDVGYGVALVNGAPVVVGHTESTNYPVTGDALQAANAGNHDVFITAVAADVKSVPFSSYLGGSGQDLATCVTSSGSVVVLGGASTSSNYDVTPGVVQGTIAGNWDAVVTAINFTTATTVTVNSARGGIGDVISHIAYLKTAGGSPIAGKTITFKVDGSTIGTSSPTTAGGVGVLSWTIPAISIGAHVINGAFAGDALYSASSGNGTLTVTTGYNTHSVVPNVTGTRGLSATVSGTLYKTTGLVPVPGKTITFIVNSVNLGTSVTNASGVATKTFTVPVGWAVGNSTIQFKFAGDATANVSTGTGTFKTL